MLISGKEVYWEDDKRKVHVETMEKIKNLIKAQERIKKLKKLCQV